MPARFGRPTSVCAARMRMGRRLKHIPGSGPYDVCLSPTQLRKLFGDKPPPKPIGCGTFACAWDHGDRVLKLTRDREDAEGLKAGSGLDRVVHVYEALELPNAGYDVRTKQQIPVYALVVEKLQPLSASQMKTISKPLETARLEMLKRAKQWRGRAESFEVEHGDQVVHKACKRSSWASCAPFVTSFLGAFRDLFRRGIVFQDAHVGNIGIDAKGRWKALDLGFSGTRRRTRIPALNGSVQQR